jgi:putative DNA primase/helicase
MNNGKDQATLGDQVMKDVDAISEVKRCAGLSPFQYEQERKSVAEKLGMRSSVLDQLVKAAREKTGRGAGGGKQGQDFLPHWKVEPWAEEVDGAALLNDLRQLFPRYSVLPSHADVALALWDLHTWVFECFDITPYLSLLSPTPRCGKTVLMTLLYFLSCRGKKNDSMSKASIYRGIEGEKPTLVLDEVGWVIDQQDDRQGILSGGFERNGFVEICEGEGADITTRRYSTYCPKAFGLVGKLTATLTDRSIRINMQRKLRTQKLMRLRRRDNDEFAALRRRCLRWANDNAEALAQAPQKELDGLNDRALDFWEPLLTIADQAGGEWPALARQAALALSGDADCADDSIIGVELLKDSRAAFGGDDVIRSVDLVTKLTADPERPWAEYNRGKPISQRQLARLLSAFRIISVNVRPEIGPQGKGYRRSDFEEAWAAYCPGQTVSPGGSALSIRPSVPRPVDIEQVDDFASVPDPLWDGSKNANLFNNHAAWDAGTDRKPESGPRTTKPPTSGNNEASSTTNSGRVSKHRNGGNAGGTHHRRDMDAYAPSGPQDDETPKAARAPALGPPGDDLDDFK